MRDRYFGTLRRRHNDSVRTGFLTQSGSRVWTDTPKKEFEIWREGDNVVIYEGTKETATRRHIFTRTEAVQLSQHLREAAL